MPFYFDPPRAPTSTATPCVVFHPFVDAEALTAPECDWLLEQVAERNPGVVAQQDGNGNPVDLKRLSVERYALGIDPPVLRLTEHISRAVLRANTEWQLEITKLQVLHVLRYQEGHEYTPHVDLSVLRPNAKLSVVALLSDPDEFEGGEFGIWTGGDGGFTKITLNRGSVVVFPAFVPHVVQPVTRGERWSLACLIEGPRFR